MKKRLPFITTGAAVLSVLIFFSPVFYPNVPDVAITIVGMILSVLGIAAGVVWYMIGKGSKNWVQYANITGVVVNVGFLLLFIYVLKVLSEYTP